MSAVWNLPLMEGSSMASLIANRKKFPTAVGFSFNQMRAGEFFYKVIRAFNWKHATGMWDYDDAVWKGMAGLFEYFKAVSDVSLELMPLNLANLSQTLYDAHRKSRGISTSTVQSVLSHLPDHMTPFLTPDGIDEIDCLNRLNVIQIRSAAQWHSVFAFSFPFFIRHARKFSANSTVPWFIP